MRKTALWQAPSFKIESARLFIFQHKLKTLPEISFSSDSIYDNKWIYLIICIKVFESIELWIYSHQITYGRIYINSESTALALWCCGIFSGLNASRRYTFRHTGWSVDQMSTRAIEISQSKSQQKKKNTHTHTHTTYLCRTRDVALYMYDVIVRMV
jgi:hypothetical protein